MLARRQSEVIVAPTAQSRPFEENWNIIQTRLVAVVLAALKENRGRKKNGKPARLFDWGEVISIRKAAHTCLAICKYQPNWRRSRVYEKYCCVLDDYLRETVLPAALWAKLWSDDADFLRRYANLWRDYQTLVYWLQKFFVVDYTRRETRDEMVEFFEVDIPRKTRNEMVKYADKAFTISRSLDTTRTGAEQHLIFVVSKTIIWKIAGKPCSAANGDIKIAILILEKSQQAQHFGRCPNLVEDFTRDLKSAACTYYEDLWQTRCKGTMPSNIVSIMDKITSNLKIVGQECGLHHYMHSRANLYRLHYEKLLVRGRNILFVGENAAFSTFLEENRVADIKKTYRMYRQSFDGLHNDKDSMLALFYGFLRAIGRTKATPRDLAKFYNQCLHLIEESFQNDEAFLRAFVSYYLFRALNGDCVNVILKLS